MEYTKIAAALGPCRRDVPRHVCFNNLIDPQPLSLATDFASIITSSVPIVVQHTRLHSRQAETPSTRSSKFNHRTCRTIAS